MEFELSTFIVLVSFFVFVFVLHRTRKPKLNLPPGPRKLPFIGNLHLFAGSEPVHVYLRDLANKYGPLMHLRLGEIDNVVVSSPEIAKEFLKTHDIIFASRPSLTSTEIGCYGNTDIGASERPRVQSLRPIREEESADLCKWIAHNQGKPINLIDKISQVNYDIMVRACLGKKSEEKSLFTKIVTDGLQNVSVFDIADVYPSIKFLLHLFTGLRKRVEKHHEQVDRIIGKIIDDRKLANEAKIDEGEKHEDLLNVLLKLQSGGSLEHPLTTDNIKAVLFFFDAKGRVDESDFDELKYLKLVIKETLRFHPTLPLLLPRESREPCQINGYDIPAKTRVLVNAWALGRDPNYWNDAESFKPERFLEKSVDFNASSLEYIPFGAGRRICPGTIYGPTIVELELAMLLYHFDWILPDGMKPEDVKMTELFGATSRRKHDLFVIPVVRRPLPV
ncbi:hypothetical protein DH2020_029933 [Rehmannia glutinosa]|uniref:Cytochrome P450 n=1 Tax=Rehmannia glutinosa TaxID=99300 RepID=A0ABR0VMX8_REHGL